MATGRSLGKILVAFVVVLLVAGAAAWCAVKVFRSNLPPYMDSLSYGVYLQGNDITSAEASEASTEESCSVACLHDTRCRAMSFIERPWGGGVCQLKDKVPKGRRADDAISAVKIFPL